MTDEQKNVLLLELNNIRKYNLQLKLDQISIKVGTFMINQSLNKIKKIL